MIINKEYELAFPADQEYNLWINSIEQDYQQEAKHRAKLVVTNRTQFVDEDLSPFNTVNSQCCKKATKCKTIDQKRQIGYNSSIVNKKELK